MDIRSFSICSKGEEELKLATYNRAAAVDYANRWWNSHNPAFPVFNDDCTNYISQCLYAGGAPMRGYPNTHDGWWIRGNKWSLSWATTHSLRWYLGGSKRGLTATQVARPEQLQLGDVILYDFQGNGRWDHATIVTAKTQDGMPLVNAHTNNSRYRNWEYRNSGAYTPNIKYIFFHINDQFS